MSNFNRFNQTFIESSHSDYKQNIDFSPNYFDFSINTLIPFRDFLFHGTTCKFIHELVKKNFSFNNFNSIYLKTEYWPPGEINQGKDQKKKGHSNEDKDKVDFIIEFFFYLKIKLLRKVNHHQKKRKMKI